ncbi:MAG TPA: hypothetical protein VGQ78_04165 [Vicinamibacteria bacterium]|nr:hypothetical protein [Vicinamibacteria bacterium]
MLALRRGPEARQALEAADRELATLPLLAGGIGLTRGGVEPYVDTLRGEILLRGETPAEGRALLQQVEQRLRALPGPDAWIQALFRLEAIARMARAVGDWDLADYTARQMLDHDSACGDSRLAAALVARQRGGRGCSRARVRRRRRLLARRGRRPAGAGGSAAGNRQDLDRPSGRGRGYDVSRGLTTTWSRTSCGRPQAVGR